jgi:hypothetical protein
VSGTLALTRDRLVEVPKAVRQKAAARGAQGTRWLRGPGDVIEQLEHDWDVVVGATLHGGSVIPMREWSSELLEGTPRGWVGSGESLIRGDVLDVRVRPLVVG